MLALLMGPPGERSAFHDKTVLITGATGSFGQAFIDTLLAEHAPEAIRCYSRDELKQSQLQQRHADDDRLRYLIGDVRDQPRLSRACQGVDVIVHAAALKQVPACEYNPFEAVKTNVVGAENVVAAAIENDVPRIIALSTDKAVNPVNLYGATKLCAEKIISQGNAYAPHSAARFSTVRYGNVVGSRGSVIPLFKAQAGTGAVTITDRRMTRFWITLAEATRFVTDCAARMVGGEIFVPKVPSMKVTDLAEALAPGCRHEVIGIRPGEKLHEVLVTADESRHCYEQADSYVIYPEYASWDREADWAPDGSRPPDGFAYTSESNERWLNVDEIRELAATVRPAVAA